MQGRRDNVLPRAGNHHRPRPEGDIRAEKAALRLFIPEHAPRYLPLQRPPQPSDRNRPADTNLNKPSFLRFSPSSTAPPEQEPVLSEAEGSKAAVFNSLPLPRSGNYFERVRSRSLSLQRQH